jgi:hypothetical protein
MISLLNEYISNDIGEITDISYGQGEFIDKCYKYLCSIFNLTQNEFEQIYSLNDPKLLKHWRDWIMSNPSLFKNRKIKRTDFCINTDCFSKRYYKCIRENIGQNPDPIIIIPLCYTTKIINTDIYDHMVMLIYRKNTNILECFDPSNDLHPFTINQIRDIFNKQTVIIPHQLYNGRIGLQKREENIGSKEMGYCAMWSFLFAELVLLYPDKKSKSIIKLLSTYSDYELKKLIRGYTMRMNNII